MVPLKDITDGFKLWRYCFFKSWLTYRQSFHSSKLGLMWPGLSLILVVIILGATWGILLEKNDMKSYMAYLLVGFPVWQVLSGIVERSSNGIAFSYTDSGLPLILEMFEKIVVSGLSFLNVVPIICIGLLALEGFGEQSIFILLLSLLNLFIWMVGVTFLLTTVSTLKPDLSHLIKALMRLSFLATPIIWEASRLGQYKEFLWLNPFYPPLEFARSAILGSPINTEFICRVLLYSFVLFCIGFISYVGSYSSVKRQLQRSI